MIIVGVVIQIDLYSIINFITTLTVKSYLININQ